MTACITKGCWNQQVSDIGRSEKRRPDSRLQGVDCTIDRRGRRNGCTLNNNIGHERTTTDAGAAIACIVPCVGLRSIVVARGCTMVAVMGRGRVVNRRSLVHALMAMMPIAAHGRVRHREGRKHQSQGQQ